MRKDIQRAYHFTEELISFPFRLLFCIHTAIKIVVIGYLIYFIFLIYDLWKYIVKAVETVINFIKKYMEELEKDIENVVNDVKKLV